MSNSDKLIDISDNDSDDDFVVSFTMEAVIIIRRVSKLLLKHIWFRHDIQYVLPLKLPDFEDEVTNL